MSDNTPNTINVEGLSAHGLNVIRQMLRDSLEDMSDQSRRMNFAVWSSFDGRLECAIGRQQRREHPEPSGDQDIPEPLPGKHLFNVVLVGIAGKPRMVTVEATTAVQAISLIGVIMKTYEYVRSVTIIDDENFVGPTG